MKSRASSMSRRSKVLVGLAAVAGAAALVYALLPVPLVNDDVVATAMSKADLDDNHAAVSLSGTVERAEASHFVLDYGEGEIKVEMDDLGFYDSGRALKKGDNVIVYGFVDDDLFERRSIEASGVYVKGLGRHFWASGIDEEDFLPIASIAPKAAG